MVLTKTQAKAILTSSGKEASFMANVITVQPEYKGKAAKYLKPLSSPPYAVLDCSLDTKTFYPGFTLGGLQTKATGEVLTEGV